MCFGSKKTENNSAEPNTRFFTIETLQQTPLTSTSWSPNSVSTPSWPPAAAGPASGPAATPYLTSQPPTPGQYATASRQPPTRLPRNSTPSGNYSTQYPQTPTYAQNPTGQFQNPAPLPRNSIPPAQIPEAFGNARARGIIRTPWEQAIDRLKPEDREGLDFNFRTERDILHGFVIETEKVKTEFENRQWKYNKSTGEKVLVRDSVNTLLLNLKKYTAIGDLVVQPLPAVVSLAWGGFKVLLNVAIADMENTTIAIESLDNLARVLAHCGIYERLYSQQALDACQSLNHSLVELYILILEYLCYLKRHLSHNTAVQAFKNIASGLESRWEVLLSKETAVDKVAIIAHQEATGKQLFAHDKKLEAMVTLLKETNALREPIYQIKSTVDDIFKSIKSDERLKILNWLSDVSPKQHHDYNKSFRSPGTGGWLLDKPSFRNWNDSGPSALLWLHGIAGSGKTTLATKIVDEMEQNTNSREYSLAYFYCNYKEAQRRDPASILRSLVKQLCLMSPGEESSFPEPVLAIYNQRKNNADLSNLLSIEESKHLLIQLSAGFLRTTIVIDALDECDAKTRGSLFNVIEEIVSSSARNPVKAFVTSRDDGDLRRKFRNSPNLYIEERDNSGDINHFIKTEIERCIAAEELLEGNVSMDLQARIISALETGARGMFIWVKHQIKKICLEISEEGIDNALTELPEDLDEMYLDILHSIRTNGSTRTSTMAESALKWVLYAVRPLSPEELISAISFSSAGGSRNLTLLAILDICQNLVVQDERSGVLRFAHYSVQEFLLKQFNLEEGHTRVAEVCLTMLVGHTNPSGKVIEPVIMDYVAFNWPEHVRLCGAGSTILTGLWKSFLTPCLAYETWVLRVAVKNEELRPPLSGTLAPLLVACYYQLVGIFAHLLNTTINPSIPNKYGRTAYHLAAINGNHKILQLLCERDGDVDSKDTEYGRTPLSWSAEKGFGEVVKMLLGNKGVDVNSKSASGLTPLSWAAENGHQKVVQMLLEKDGVDVNRQSRSGQGPLSWAAEKGHEKVVHMLLQRGGVDVDSKSNNGRTPLSWAAANGHEKVVTMLLAKEGVDVNSTTTTGRTPLSWAAGKGHEKVVQILLAKDGVDVENKDTDYGQTPLSWAAESGREKVVRMLLQNERVDVNSRSTSGRTPLSWAAEKGREKVVQMLLEKNSVDVNTKTTTGRTPLSWAAEKGHHKVLQMLLNKEGVDVDTKDTEYGRTALSWASVEGHQKVVQMLRKPSSYRTVASEPQSWTPRN